MSKLSTQELLTIKTGATEASGKVPTQIWTFLRCVLLVNTLFFSDMRQQIGQVQLAIECT